MIVQRAVLQPFKEAHNLRRDLQCLARRDDFAEAGRPGLLAGRFRKLLQRHKGQEEPLDFLSGEQPP